MTVLVQDILGGQNIPASNKARLVNEQMHIDHSFQAPSRHENLWRHLPQLKYDPTLDLPLMAAMPTIYSLRERQQKAGTGIVWPCNVASYGISINYVKG